MNKTLILVTIKNAKSVAEMKLAEDLTHVDGHIVAAPASFIIGYLASALDMIDWSPAPWLTPPAPSSEA